MKNLSAILLLVVVLIVYLSTICPSVYVGDSGEIIAACYSMGIAHPPGYPLYCFLGKIFTYLPLSNIAYRVNLVAVFFGSATVLIFFLTLSTFFTSFTLSTSSTFLAFSTSLIFAFSRTFWCQSVIAKGGIYTLNSFLLIILLILFLRIIFNKDGASLLVFALFSGLILTNHHTSLAIVVISFIFLYFWQKDLLVKNFWKIVLLFLIGLSFYLYLPIRAISNPSMNWGNITSWQGLLDLVFRKQYGGFAKGEITLYLFSQQILTFLKTYISQFTIFLVPYVILGLFYLYKNNKKIFIYTLFIFLTFTIVMILLINPKMNRNDLEVIEVFYIPAYLVSAIWLFFGFCYFIALFKNKSFSTFVTLFTSFTFLLPLGFNYFENDRSKNYIAYNYGINMLKTPEKNSILFASQDNEVFILAYFKKVEGVREDVTIYEDLGCVFENIYRDDMLKLSMKEHQERRKKVQMNMVNTTQRPVYFLRTSSMYQWMKDKAKLTGIMFALNKKTDKDYFEIYNFDGIEDKKIYKEYLVRDIMAQYYFSQGEYYFEKKQDDLAFGMFDKAQEIGHDISWVSNNIGIIYETKGLIDKSIENYNKAIMANPSSAVAHYNLGLSLSKKGMIEDAIKEYREALRINPNYSDACNNLGNLYIKNKDFELAINELLKAIGMNPGNPDSYYNLGVAYNETNDFKEAISSFEKAISLKPDYVEAYNNIAVAYFLSGHKEKAIELWEKTLKIKPDFRDAKVNLQRVKGSK
ncbi:MAG: tetratricopeptide repeat protein [Candidatus Firestonebacteria bacterium]